MFVTVEEKLVGRTFSPRTRAGGGMGKIQNRKGTLWVFQRPSGSTNTRINTSDSAFSDFRSNRSFDHVALLHCDLLPIVAGRVANHRQKFAGSHFSSVTSMRTQFLRRGNSDNESGRLPRFLNSKNLFITIHERLIVSRVAENVEPLTSPCLGPFECS